MPKGYQGDQVLRRLVPAINSHNGIAMSSRSSRESPESRASMSALTYKSVR
jgi:hypothetical protein